MKRFLGIVLSVMLIVSLFAVNVSATPIASYETITVYDVPVIDFESGTSDFTEVGVTLNYLNGTMSVSGGHIQAASMPAVLPAKYTVEFDVMPVAQESALVFIVNSPDCANTAYTTLSLLIPGYSMKDNVWYNYIITVDESKLALSGNTFTGLTVERKEMGTSEWQVAGHYVANNWLNGTVKTDESGVTTYDHGNLYRNTFRSFTSSTAFPVTENSIGFGTMAAWYDAATIDPELYTVPTSTDYRIDNVKVYHSETVLAGISDTVYLSQDFEDPSNTAATEAMFGIGSNVAVEENGNTYRKLTPNATGGLPVLLGQNMGFDKYQDICVTFDIMAEKPGVFGIEFYSADGSKTLDYVQTGAEGHELGDWYTYKFSRSTVDGRYVARKNLTDNTDWECLHYAGNGAADDGKNNYGVGTAASTMYSAIRFVNDTDSRRLPANTVVADCVYYIDNIMVTSDEYIKVTDVAATETAVSAKVNFANSELLNKIGTDIAYSVMMASYDGSGKLVDADISVEIPVGTAVEAELSVDKTDDVRVYVWNSADGTPLMGTVFDLDAWID